MELLLQCGHNMMSLCRELTVKWGGGTVILSPRDLEEKQLCRFSGEIIQRGGRTLLDPQLYNPRASHPKLTNHTYWPNDYHTNLLADGASVFRWLSNLRSLNEKTGTLAYLVPGYFCNRVDELWLGRQEFILETASQVLTDKPRLATLCLSAETLRFEDQFESLLSRSEAWDVDGYYVVAEHPRGQYLVDDPLWLANLLLFCAGLKLQRRQVIVGYSSHQNLCLAAANVDAIASGNFLNVRSFSTKRFDAPNMDPSRRARWWYYCPQALSEFTVAFMDLGFQTGILDHLMPDRELGSHYADLLFSGALPSSTGWKETDAQTHYLHALHGQAAEARRQTFEETLNAQAILLETAARYIEFLHENNVRGQDRDFENIVDVNLSALGVLKKERGFALSHDW